MYPCPGLASGRSRNPPAHNIFRRTSSHESLRSSGLRDATRALAASIRSTAVPGYSGSIIGVFGGSVAEEECSLDEDVLDFWMSPVGVMTNADVLLVLLPEETAAAAKLENRVLADAVANEKTTEDKKRIWRDQRHRNQILAK